MTIRTLPDPSSNQGILGLTSYDPASLGTFTLTVTSKTKLDTTNLTLTFVPTASGNVLIEVNCAVRAQSTATGVGPAVFIQLVDHGTTTQRGKDVRIWDLQENDTSGFALLNATVRATAMFYLTGLTPGVSMTVDLAAFISTVTNASGAIFAGGGAGSMGAITMKATAAP